MEEPKKKEITPEEKLAAILLLREDVTNYTNAQTAFNLKLDKAITFLKRLLMVGLLLSVSFIGVCAYLFFKPAPASEITLKYINEEKQYLENREKLFVMQKEDFVKDKQFFQKEKELFVQLKARQDSDMDRRRQDIIKMLDRIEKAKNK